MIKLAGNLWKPPHSESCKIAALYPGLLAAVFVACGTNAGEGLVNLIMCSDVRTWTLGRCAEKWHIPSIVVQLRGNFLNPRTLPRLPDVHLLVVRGLWL